MLHLKSDLERSEIDVFQHDPFGGHHNLVMDAIDVHFDELISEREKFFIERSNRRCLDVQQRAIQLVLNIAQFADEEPQLFMESLTTPLSSDVVLALFGFLDLSFEALQLFPTLQWELNGVFRSGGLSVVSVLELDGSVESLPIGTRQVHEECSF